MPFRRKNPSLGPVVFCLFSNFPKSATANLFANGCNLEPKETTPLGSCIGTWDELLWKKKKKRKAELAAQHSAPIPQALVQHLGVGPIFHPSHCLVICLSHWWFDPFGLKPRCWVLPSAIGFYPPSLGSTLHCWVLPFVVGFHPSSLCSTLRHWVLPSVWKSDPVQLLGAHGINRDRDWWAFFQNLKKTGPNWW